MIGSIIGSMFALLFFGLIVTLFVLLIKLIWSTFNDTGSFQTTPWETQYQPNGNKYYVQRIYRGKIMVISNTFGFKKYYKEKYQAELVVDLLNKS